MPRATLDSIMVFVLDNYDSFTYNLVQYLGELGAEVEVYRNDELTVEQVEALKPERILLSPGPCTPGEAGILVTLIRHMAKMVLLYLRNGLDLLKPGHIPGCAARSSPLPRPARPRRA